MDKAKSKINQDSTSVTLDDSSNESSGWSHIGSLLLHFLPLLLVIALLVPFWCTYEYVIGNELVGTVSLCYLAGNLEKNVVDNKIKLVVESSSNRFKEKTEVGKATIYSSDPKGEEKGTIRVRLGDVVYGGNRGENPGTQVYYAAVYDERFSIDSVTGDQPPSRSKSALNGLSYSIAHAESKEPEKNGFSKKGFSDQQVTEQNTKNRLTPPVLEITGKGSSNNTKNKLKPAQGRSTTPDVVTSAVMAALLRAESIRVESVVFTSLGTVENGLSQAESLNATKEGIKRVANYLSRVSDIYIQIPEKNVSPARSFSLSNYLETLWSFATNPNPLPGGKKIYMPVTLADSGKSPPENRAEIFSNLFKYDMSGFKSNTFFPAATFLLIIGWAIIRQIRYLPEKTRILKFSLLRSGIFMAVILIAMMMILDRFWIWLPSGWSASLPTFICVAVAAGSLNAYIVFQFNANAFHNQTGKTERDNLLRSVLNRDAPVESLSEDQLGFGSLINALKRFLDNRDTKPPVVISVNGPWGSGKSSLMKMLVDELNKTGRFHTVWFNAWRYHKEEQILAAFLKTMVKELSGIWKPTLAVRIALARLKQFSYIQFLLLLSPFVMIIAVYYGRGNEKLLFLTKAILEYPKVAFATASTIGAPAAIVGSVWSYRRYFKPFALQFKNLYDIRDQSKKIGFIDEFTQEFRLYREAVGDRKFLIVIDDLDRCPPDKVVDVLKVINLIITSGEGAGRSFFLLGFDSKYILKSIEIHFREFAKSGEAVDHDFAKEYLKKMVTISVSIPVATSSAVKSLVEKIDDEKSQPAKKKHETGKRGPLFRYMEKIPAWAVRFGIALLTLVLIFLPFSFKVPPITTPGGISTQQEKPETNFSGTVVIKMPELPAPSFIDTPGTFWILAGLLAVLCVAFILRNVLPLVAGMRYKREPEDSARFQTAIALCQELLPNNPRDIIRLVNKMRMGHLVQSSETVIDAGYDAFAGSSLDEWESVSLTLLQQRNPEFFDPEFLENHYIPELSKEPATSFDDILTRTLIKENNNATSIARDIHHLAGRDASIGHLLDPGKIQRYVEINRHILDLHASFKFKTDDTAEKK